jgi:competence protein ComEA
MLTVPRRGAAAPPAAASAQASTAIVHLNSATLEQLEGLDGIGPSLAARMVAWRLAHGGFHSIDDLGQVPGIGPARLEALRGRVAP